MLAIIREMRKAVSVPIAAQPRHFRTTDATPCFTKLPQFPDEMEAIQLPRSAFENFAEAGNSGGYPIPRRLLWMQCCLHIQAFARGLAGQRVSAA